MLKNEETQIDKLIPPIKEKGDLGHAIRCTEQARNRATAPWLKEACGFRLRMLREQLSRQRAEY